ncbi:MAG: DHH family phosphoesterase, partial [Candidatus Omnitrophica bacterium]|nr:DHH family phosphoesterase [Candidatus Omnitrophota bacterium]
MMKVSSLLVELLKRRGLTRAEDQDKFLRSDLSCLTPPFLIPGLEEACRRLLIAREKREKVFIYGDGDIDGISAVALLKKLTDILDVPAEYYLTHRLEEFEIEEELISGLAKNGYSLLMTVDCGTSSRKALEKAVSLGLEVIVLDHHLAVGESFPPGHIYLNPKLGGWPESLRELSSVGVVMFFVMGMEALTPGLREEQLSHLMELAALGTLGDCAPLIGDNRILVKEGLKRLPASRVHGLRHLSENLGLNLTLTCKDVIMRVNPRLNAPGRFGRPEVALRLFFENSEENLKTIFQEIEEYDRKR